MPRKKILIKPAGTANTCDRPLAAEGLLSYRCKGTFGWIMIGATDDDDAFREALRSSDKAKRETLQRWDGLGYVDVTPNASTVGADAAKKSA